MKTTLLYRRFRVSAVGAAVGLCLLAQPARALTNGCNSPAPSLGAFSAVGTITFDTDALTYGGIPGGVDNDGVAVFRFDSIAVPAGTTVVAVGSRPLALLSAGAVTVDGTLSVNGEGATGDADTTPNPGGAGGGAGGQGCGVAGGGPGGGAGGTPSGDSGSGGGGFGGVGGNGGQGSNLYPGTPGAGGVAYGDVAVAIEGGSGGAGGTDTYGLDCTTGGGGGGGVLVQSETGITISATGIVSADGGDVPFFSNNGAPGGGSGGGIVLIAPSVQNDGTVTAEGGAGGHGGCCGGGGGGGGGRIATYGTTAGVGTYSVAGGPRYPGDLYAGQDGSPGVLTTGTLAEASTCSCPDTPLVGCKAPVEPLKSILLIKDNVTDNSKDKVVFKWAKGAATTLAELGNPTVGTSYALCIYDKIGGIPFLEQEATIPPGGTCDGNPCWKATATGFVYKDKATTSDGVLKVLAKSGIAGKAKTLVKGKGADMSISVPPLTKDTNAVAQTINSLGTCWEGVYSTAIKNESGLFKAKSD